MKIYVRSAKRPDWLPRNARNAFTENEYQFDKIRRKMFKEIDHIPDILAEIANTSNEWYDMIGDVENEKNRNKILHLVEDVLDVDEEIWEADDLLGAHSTLELIVRDVHDMLDEAKQYM